MIIVPIVGPSAADARRQVRASVRDADMFELRLDLLSARWSGPALAAFIRGSKRPVIATCRPVREGGRFEGPEEDRFARIGDAVRAGAAYADCEQDAVGAFRVWCGTRHLRPRLIVSQHILTPGLPAIGAAYRRLRAARADVIKFVYTATDAWEISGVQAFLRRAARDRQPAIAIAMGEAGEASRVLYRVFGGWATFAAASDGEGSAPGQPTAAVMRRVFRAHERTARTRVYGLVGQPVRQSKGIYIHNPLYARAGFNGIYVRFPVTDLDRFIRRVGPLLRGCSVTLPHKAAMAKKCGTFTGSAACIGAVNTVVRTRTGWRGANTDAAAALDAIERKMAVSGRRITILGAGGAARAIAVEAVRRGARVTLANRTAARAATLGNELGVPWCPLAAVGKMEPEILVNTTAAGMWPAVHDSPLREIPAGVRLAFDAIYNPGMTRFLTMAESRGATVVTGVTMYAGQAVDQIRILTGLRVTAGQVLRLFRAASVNH